MHMHSLDQLITRVVERKGYQVQGTDSEALFARKGDETLLAAWKTDGPVTAQDAQLFAQAFDQISATSGVLVAPRGADAAVAGALAGRKVEVWAESRVIVEVGDALLKDALDAAHPAAAAPPAAQLPPTPKASLPPTPTTGGSKFPSLVAQAAASVGHNSGAAYFMPSKPKKEVPADMRATIPQKGGSLGYAWGGATGGTSSAGIAQVRSGRHPSKKVDQWGNLIKEGPGQGQGQGQGAQGASSVIVPPDDVEIVSTPKKGRAAPAPSAQVAAPKPGPAADSEAYEIITTPKKSAPAATPQGPPPGATNVLQLKVSKEEALVKTQAKAGAIVKLALVPHVAFEYDVHVEREGLAQPIEGKGALLLSSLTGELRTVDGLAYATSEPADARKEQEKLQAVDLYDKVKGHMAKTFSRTLNVEREVAGNTVMENLKVTPDPEEMGLQHRGVVYVPVWEITGGGVNTKVDAFTGATL